MPISTKSHTDDPTHMIRRLVTFALVLCFVVLAVDLSIKTAIGGDMWRQGDWLINNHNVAARRGPVGSVILGLSDLFGLKPNYVVLIFQLVFAAVVYCIAIGLCWRKDVAPASLLLLLVPGSVIAFWASGATTMRKEVVAFAAFALLLSASGQVRRVDWRHLLAVCVFVFGCFAHEALVLLSPAFLALYVLTARPVRKHVLYLVAVLVLGGVGALWYALSTPVVSDFRSVCLPLTERGLDEGICLGAIRALERSLSIEIGRVVETHLAGLQFIEFSLIAAFCVVVFKWVLGRTLPPRRTILLASVAIIPVLPLYVIALDWGRWLSWQVTVFAFLVLADLVRARVVWAGITQGWAAMSAVAVGLLFVPTIEIGLVIGGILQRIIAMILTI